MKIGINASFARKPDSGTGQVTINFLKKLAEMETKEHQFFIYLEQDLPEDFKLPKNFEKRIFLPMLYKRDDLMRKMRWEKKSLPKKIKQDGCDIFLSLYQSATVLKHTRHVMFVHDAVWKIFPRYLNNFRKKAYYRLVDKAIRQADRIITNSQNSKKDISQMLGSDSREIEICQLDCDPIFKKEISKEKVGKVLKKYELSAGEYIFYVGGFDFRKNLRRLFEGYGLLWKKYNQKFKIPPLVLAGKFYPNLVPLVADLPLYIEHLQTKFGCPKDQVKLIDFVPCEELPMLYRGANFFCYPSLYEGFGLPVLEAANVGCAIISSRTSSIPEVVDSKAAVLIDPRQSENIAIAMHLLLTDQNLKQKIIQQAKRQASKFDWSKTTNKIMKIVTETHI